MSLAKFTNKFKVNNQAGADPAPGAPAAVAAGTATVDLATLQSQTRELQIAQAQREAAKREAEEAKRQLAEAQAERDRTTIKNAILAASSRPDRKALNAEHVFNLKSQDFIIHNGKVVSKADPSKDVDSVLGEFFAGEGKYLLAPTVPGGGTGAPGTQRIEQAPKPDLTTKEGLTAVTRGITHRLFGTQGAPAQPAAQGAGAPAAKP